MPHSYQADSQTTDNDQDVMREGLIEQRKSAVMEMEDKELVLVANEWLLEAKPLYQQFKKRGEKSERYYLGKQIDESRLNRFQAKITDNRIWQSVETIVPIATRNLPAPMISLPDSNDTAKEADYRTYTDNFEEALLAIAVSGNAAQKLKDFLRFNQIYHLGVMKFGYDEEEGIWFDVIRPHRILIPPYDSDEYVIEYHEDTVKDLIKRFPEKEKEIKELSKSSQKEVHMGSRIAYYEITTHEMKFWKVQDIILRKEDNPHYDFKNPKNNHWRTPKYDYIFSDLWRMGKNGYSQTTIIEQAISLQDGLNKRKRQISDNADAANGVLLGMKNMGAQKKDIAAIAEARLKGSRGVVVVEGDNGAYQNFTGQQIPAYVFEDMLDTRKAIDNIMGTHSTTRGEKTSGEITFGGQQLLKEADESRIGELTQMLERVMEQLYNAFAQMIKIHFGKDEWITYLGTDGTSVQRKIDKKIVKEGVGIHVRQGSTVVKDKVSLQREAVQLMQLGVMDPITFYERIGDPHPYKTAERLFLYQNAPDQLFARVAAELEQRTMSDEEEKVLKSVARARIDAEALLRGENVAPPENVTVPSMKMLGDIFSAERVQQLPQEVRNRIANYVEGAKERMQTQLEDMRGAEEEKKSDFTVKPIGR